MQHLAVLDHIVKVCAQCFEGMVMSLHMQETILAFVKCTMSSA